MIFMSMIYLYVVRFTILYLLSCSYSHLRAHRWSNYTVFSPGTRVRYKDKIYVSIGKHNAAEPDDATHARFFVGFTILKFCTIMISNLEYCFYRTTNRKPS